MPSAKRKGAPPASSSSALSSRYKKPKRREKYTSSTPSTPSVDKLVVTPATVSENWKRLQSSINAKDSSSTPRRSGGVGSDARHSWHTRNRRHRKGRVALPKVVREKRAKASSNAAALPSGLVGVDGVDSSSGCDARKRQLLTPANSETRITKRIALDCEMVGVGPDGKDSELARVCIINSFGNVVYDKYVKPRSDVTDYRTKYSGIRKEDLVGAPEFDIVQAEVSDIIKDRIVIGHALSNDFQALLLSHPHLMTRDTAKYAPLQKRKGKPQALRKLAKSVFNVDIQVGEHSPAEDARVALLLYKKHKHQWEKSFERKRMRKTYGKGKRRKPAQSEIDQPPHQHTSEKDEELPSWLTPIDTAAQNE